jgi:hypothetical protein
MKSELLAISRKRFILQSNEKKLVFKTISSVYPEWYRFILSGLSDR